MKIVDRKTFLALPSDTVYSKYAPCLFGELCIKGDTWDNDFTYQNIVGSIECNSDSEFFDLLAMASENQAVDLKMDFDCMERDALYDADQLFAVWDDADVAALIERLKMCVYKKEG